MYNPDQSEEVRKFLEAGHTFAMRLPDDAFRKLYREWKRFEKADEAGNDLHDQVDGAINTATMAWHMADWVWEFYKPNIKKTFQVETLRDFQTKLKKECPELKICDIVANAAKHGGAAYKTDDRPELISIIHAEDDDATLDAAAEQENEKLWRLELRVDGKTVDLATSFHRVFMFWFDFLRKYR